MSPGYGVYRPHSDRELLPEYAELLFRTSTYISEFMIRSTGIRSSRLRLYPESFLRIPVLTPPAHEQEAILARVASKTRHVDATIAGARREIELLREYRPRLIADVVTGKLDVREAAVALPAEAADREDGAGMGRDRVASRRGRERGPGLAGIRDLG